MGAGASCAPVLFPAATQTTTSVRFVVVVVLLAWFYFPVEPRRRRDRIELSDDDEKTDGAKWATRRHDYVKVLSLNMTPSRLVFETFNTLPRGLRHGRAASNSTQQRGDDAKRMESDTCPAWLESSRRDGQDEVKSGDSRLRGEREMGGKRRRCVSRSLAARAPFTWDRLKNFRLHFLILSAGLRLSCSSSRRNVFQMRERDSNMGELTTQLYWINNKNNKKPENNFFLKVFFCLFYFSSRMPRLWPIFWNQTATSSWTRLNDMAITARPTTK